MEEVQTYANDLLSASFHILDQDHEARSKYQDLLPSVAKLAQAFLDSRLPNGWLAIRQDGENGQVLYVSSDERTQTHPWDAYFKFFVARELHNYVARSKRPKGGLIKDKTGPGVKDLGGEDAVAPIGDRSRRQERAQKQASDPTAHF